MNLVGESDVSKGTPWTVGIGNTVGVGPDTRVSKVQARSDLSKHINQNLRELDKLVPTWKTMPFPIQTVLVNLVYNMGVAGLAKFKNTLTYLKAGNYAAAAANLERSLWYKQVGIRAKEIVARVRTNSIEPKHLVP
jgi:lysozyme